VHVSVCVFESGGGGVGELNRNRVFVCIILCNCV
jgi:hypothetical protein